MEVLIASICDYALNDNGKLLLMGAFDTIYASQLPAGHPYCSIAFRLLVTNNDPAKNQFKLEMLDPDGINCLPSITGPFETQLLPDMPFVSRNIVINLVDLPLTKEGRHTIQLHINDAIFSRIPLLVAVKSSGVANTKHKNQKGRMPHRIASWIWKTWGTR